ncbi:dihydrodipicolinate synthase family protein [Sphaerochaeta halotolerans]|jgi:4-hydroxy-tetrahydrodipicolinate synthase|uniref:dihydrodipicolinate synthase family protein n=1 Tax=Sphaerochaeta halotolerans TaxID=2293840 RepID=UPI001370F01E|nr:dihydrodipicolinate synthase family protein [Sphaerochaeta halotolerans]MDN5334030.1 hypothetical protein [Sphaerochaeta sp.]MXI86980.1 dihydrodipicolinate synthase family protein [Sphaerochaeta halotolerans]
MKKLYGLTTAMITAFRSDGSVDIPKMKELTRFQIERGAHCLYPCGTTGEMYLLSEEERKSVAEAVVEEAASRATVFIHVGAMHQDETIRLAQHAEKIGADGVGVVTPSYFHLSDRELIAYFVMVAKSVSPDFPVYLYNIPQCAGNDLKADVIAEIRKQATNVIGVKYSFADFVRTNEYVALGNGFSVVIGADILFLPGLAMGCTGTVSGVASAYPEPFVAIYKAFQEGDIEKARELQAFGIEIANILKNGSNMSYFKTALAHRGLPAGSMRAPLLDITEEEKKNLIVQLEDWERRFFKKNR